MSGSGRRRSSKWDLREEERHFESENVQDDSWPGKAVIYHDKELETEWLSPGVAVSNNSKWSTLEANDLLKSKRDVGMASGEPLPRSRGSVKDHSYNKGRNRNLESNVTWDEDGSYGTRMSPGLDEWRGPSHSPSPKNVWSRSIRGRSRSRSRSRSRGRSRSRSRSLSRSRSPVRGIRRESGFHDRTRSRGASIQVCRDFTAGRCRRGNHCHFLHQGNQHHEDNWESRHRKDGDSKYSTTNDTREYTSRIGRSTPYCTDFVRGKCRRGASCRYAHDGASDSFDKVSGNDSIRERENRRNRDASFERGGEPEHRRGGDVPCKFFAAGNCRNGKYCRFSHHSKADLSPDGRSRGDRWGLGHNSDDVDRLWDGPKLSEWSNTVTVSDTTRSEDKSGKLDAPVATLTSWSINDTRWGHGMDKEKKSCGKPAVDKAAENNEKAGHLWMAENPGASIGISESRGAEKWLGDMDMSPDWNYAVQSANHAVKEEHGQSTQASQSLGSYDPSLMARGQDITKEASVQFHGAAAAMQPIINDKSYFQQNHSLMGDGANVVSCDDKIAVEKIVSSSADLNVSSNIMPGQCFNQNGRSLSSLPLSNMIAVGQNQVVTPNASLRGGTIKYQQNLAFSSEGKPLIQPDIGDDSALQVNPGIPPSQGMVSGEQLTKLTNLSASLAQFFGDRKQLPQLYAALNSHNPSDIPSFTNPEVPLQPVLAAHVQKDQAIRSQQYDPVCDGIESKKPGCINNLPGLKSNSLGPKSSVDGKPELPLKNLSLSSFPVGPNGTDLPRTGSSEEPNHKSQQSNKLYTGAHGEAMENNQEGTEERKQAQEGNQKDQEDGPSGNADGDAGEDEGKKSKDVKGIRAFKFALVEFVKELLKPTWKEGQISKDAYKTIVKKVVDKVTGGQGANIPQTQERIDHYLSSSKPKLTKLVQAYVEKTQKG